MIPIFKTPALRIEVWGFFFERELTLILKKILRKKS